MRSSHRCVKCGTEWSARTNDCPFCGTHHHGQPGRICSCGEYIPTAREERELDRIEAEPEYDYFGRIPEL